MSDILKFVIENPGYPAVIALIFAALAYQSARVKKLEAEKEAQRLAADADLKSILKDSNEVFSKVISSGELHTQALRNEIRVVAERLKVYTELIKDKN